MKSYALFTITSIFFLSSLIAQGSEASTEVTGFLHYYFPDDTSYDSGIGGEVQIRFWPTELLGFAMAAGFMDWEGDEEIKKASEGFTVVGGKLGGSVWLFPVGGSLLLRPTVNESSSFIIEAGARYVYAADPDVYADPAATNTPGPREVASGGLDIDDGVIGLVAASLEFDLSSNSSLLCSFGYQFDLDKGGRELLGDDIGDNELKAFYAGAGISIGF